ncbi:serine protein kinase [Aspergillus ibericus CBS 121593]|uniref:non-specific serine/threonine protein kinase n=1 Tax=Aspergillus ibericus CBS 121593 TaxID=1448316 RepID=A0A395GT91_9EURO|nr:serine protein kinase [Aspergillus ibericus CBS 121593]RAK98168.1 serine protein kinase [Aspergillus ibericus CBS 121593]
MHFHSIPATVELIDHYRQGGYHPVHLGDEFHHGRYKVLAKLGHNASSTTWLARDNEGPQPEVSLKVLQASASKNNRELAMHQRLATTRTADHPGKGNNHVVELLDHFYHEGPNGRHLCLVFPAMVSDVRAMVTSGAPLNARDLGNLARQVLRGVQTLHAAGIGFCDLRPENIMVAYPVPTCRWDCLQPALCMPVEWRGGLEKDESVPRYLVQSQRYPCMVEREDFDRVVVVIGDLEGAQWIKSCDRMPGVALSMRAPEVIGKGRWDERADIWGLGCLIYELATNEILFPVKTRGVSEEKVDENHLGLIEWRLGEHAPQGFAVYLGERLPRGSFTVKDVERLAEVLLHMLQIAPTNRWSVNELLETPFIKGRY